MKRLFVTALILIVLAFAGAVRSEAAAIGYIAGTGLTSQAIGAFNRAANLWDAALKDDVQVTITLNFQDMGSPTILGSTGSVYLAAGFSTIRNAMVADAADEVDDAIVGYLPTAAQFSATAPAGTTLAGMAATKANLKAMGFEGLDETFGANDATMTFNTGFNFDYDNSDGVTAGY